ncbi:MAG: hypothetical protein KDA80_21850, partial [Planctomycetaceae bacterium]|nr:hypothetical protein [Planctomycetaceae bacterium]
MNFDQPLLNAVVEELSDWSADQSFCDLSNVTVVFPGSQAGRRFQEILALSAGGALSPPRILTVGQLPEELYHPQKPFATHLTQRMAWAKALQQFDQERLRVVIRHPPALDDLTAWMRLGELFRKQHRELAGDGLNFGDVAEQGASLPEFQEAERWEVMTELQQNYLDLLDAFSVWDRQTARLVA